MPKRVYTPDEKKLVRRLLLLHQGNVPIVQHLTGYPRRTIEYWRAKWEDDYELYTDAFAQNLLSHANAMDALKSPSSPDDSSHSPIAQRDATLAQYAQMREKLMQHATSIADNLMLADGFVSQRVYALTRLLDRVLALDKTLPNMQPENAIRLEYHYDNAIHDNPPWAGNDTDTYEGSKRYNETYLRGMKQQLDQQLAQSFPDEYANDPAPSPPADPNAATDF